MDRTVSNADRRATRKDFLHLSCGDYLVYRDEDGSIRQALPLSVPDHALPQFGRLVQKAVRSGRLKPSNDKN